MIRGAVLLVTLFGMLSGVLSVAAPAPAHAAPGDAFKPPEPEPEAMGEPAKERPWAEGVTLEMQQSALSHFREGNAFLKESLFRQAGTPRARFTC